MSKVIEGNKKVFGKQEVIMQELVPIVLFLTVGITIISFFYFIARERQLLIQKQTPVEDKDALKGKNPGRQGYTLVKIGIILVFFGIGLGAGTPFVDRGDSYETMMAVSIFVFTGLGFIVANIVGKKLEKREEEEERQRLNA
jgi:hypothetical protein